VVGGEQAAVDHGGVTFLTGLWGVGAIYTKRLLGKSLY
jgi:hypothetical protein